MADSKTIPNWIYAYIVVFLFIGVWGFNRSVTIEKEAENVFEELKHPLAATCIKKDVSNGVIATFSYKEGSVFLLQHYSKELQSKGWSLFQTREHLHTTKGYKSGKYYSYKRGALILILGYDIADQNSYEIKILSQEASINE